MSSRSSSAARVSPRSSSRRSSPASAAPTSTRRARRFLRLLTENGRLDFLPEIAARFKELEAEDRNVAEVEVVSATQLDERQQERLAAALRTRLRREVRLHCAVDPALIGGAVVRSGDMLIDGSLRGKLERLETELTA